MRPAHGAVELASVVRPDALAAHGDGTPPAPEVFSEWIEETLRDRGLARPPAGHADEADAGFVAWWLLRMAAITYERALRPLPEVRPEVRSRLEWALARRPAADARYAQLHIDIESSLRRAAAVADALRQAPGPVLAVGDDDALGLAWAASGMTDIHVVDIDRALLRFLRDAGTRLNACIATHEADIFRQPLPESLRHRCAAAVTDPIRNGEDATQFLAFAAASLRRDAPCRLFLVDHPDWNLEHATLQVACRTMGLRCLEVLENLHAYPLSPDGFPRRRDAAARLGWATGRLERLIARTSAWSHLYVFARG